MPYYRDAAGNHLGTWIGAVPPGGIEAPVPANAAATWNGRSWDEPPPPRREVPLVTVVFRLLQAGLDVAAIPGRVQAAIEALPEEQRRYAAAKMREPITAIYADDEIARALITAIGGDPATILDLDGDPQ